MYKIIYRYYHADSNETRKKIKQLINDKKWNANKFPEMKQNLLKILHIKNPHDDEKPAEVKNEI